MPAGASTRRYAQAVFELAADSGELERWLDDLTLLADSAASQQLRQTLSAPRISLARKERVIRESLGGSVSPLALNLMALLTSRNLVHILPEIADRYQEMLDDHNGIERAEIVSAAPLSDDQLRQAAESLSRMSDKDVRVTTRVDSDLLGGIVIRIGDKVIDGSARARLRDMRRELVQRR